MFLFGQEGFKKILRSIFLVFIAVFPFLQYRGFLFNGTSTRSFNLILLIEILVVVIGFLMYRKKTEVSIIKSPILIGLFVLFISMAISAFLGVDLHVSFWSKITRTTGLYYFLHLGVFYLLVTGLFVEKKDLRKLIKVFVVSSVVFSLGALLSMDGLKIFFANREWAGFTFGNSSFAAMYLFAGFVMSLYYAYSSEKKDRNIFHYLFPILIILNPYLLGLFRKGFIGAAQSSSIAVFATIVMLLGAWAISKINSVKVRRALILGFMVVGLLVSIFAVKSFLTSGGFIQEKYLEKATAARPFVWELSDRAIKERPVFGWGLDNFDKAYQSYYDNKVMEKVNGAEAWFDKAHNVFVDQAVEGGYVGVLVYFALFLTIIGSMIYVLFNSKEKNNQALAVFVIVYFIGHLMEIQTAFDTTISYLPLSIMASLATLVLYQTRKSQGVNTEFKIGTNMKYVGASLAIVLFAGMFFIGTVPVFRAQITNGYIRTAGSSEKRLLVYKTMFNSPIDLPGSLNRTVTDFQKGISLSPNLLTDPNKVEGFKKELDVFVDEYEKYLATNTNDYRASTELVNIYIYQRLFDVDNLAKAHIEADKAIEIVPNAPQAYWQHAVAYLYQRKFNEARLWSEKALNLNTKIEESQHVSEYIEKSIKTFPEIDLFNFIML